MGNTPQIRIEPFSEFQRAALLGLREGTSDVLAPTKWLDDASGLELYTSGTSALERLLGSFNLESEDEVLIETTTQGPYVSGCVTRAIEKFCRWSREPGPRTRVALVIHEFGFPCAEERVAKLSDRGWIVVEDCAWAVGSRFEGAPVGRQGDYALYSLAKSHPVQRGGVLVGRSALPPTDLNSGEAAELRHALGAGQIREWNQARLRHWRAYAEALEPRGLNPYFELAPGVVPGVYLTRAKPPLYTPAAKARLNELGIQSTLYYGQDGYFFPVHQFLTESEREFVARSVASET